MGVYIYNSPIVFPKEKNSALVKLSIDGTYWKYGKKVSSWSNVRSNKTWISVEYRSLISDGNGKWAYNFAVSTISDNTSINERYAICYADYVLEDGTTGTASFTVYQLGESSILCSADNPMVFGADDYQNAFSPTITYLKAKNSTNIDKVYVNGDWDAVGTAAGFDGTNYQIEYDISPKYYNVYAEDNTGNLKFSYINPETNVRNDYFLYLVQAGCQYPFGITYTNGDEIPIEGVGINTRKRIRKIPFKGGKVYLSCCYPYLENNSITVELDGGDWVRMSTGGGYPDDNIAEEQYTITFDESFETDVRSCTLDVEYYSLDGVKHTDSVQLIQDASDGSNLEKSVICNVDKIKVQADGKPELSSGSNIRVRYVGNIDWTAPTYPQWMHMGQPILIEGEGTYNRLYEWPVTYDINTTDEVRTAIIDFPAEDIDGNTFQDSIEVIQAKAVKEDIVVPEIPVEGDEYIGPIWKDVEYNFGSIDMVEYSIYKGDTPIFLSRTNRRPNQIGNTILVNKICQNYMEIPRIISDVSISDGNLQTFKLCSLNGSVVYKTYKFINDWSYSKDFKTGLLSHPILNDYTKVYYGQLLPFSVFGAAEQVAVEYGIRYKDGYVDKYDRPVDDWITTEYVKNGVSNVNFPYAQRNPKDGVKGYMINGVEYELTDCCKVDYVLYYINPFGGYDWFPIRGKVTETDTLTQYTYTQNYNNTSLEFGKNRYLSEIHKKFTLNTHWLREDESKRMWYLMQSNVVYLHNIKTNELYPVVITNTTQEHKQRGIKTNRISYQIEVELSQTRERL